MFEADINAESAVADELSSAIAARFGFDATVMARTLTRRHALLSRNRFTEAAAKPNPLRAFLIGRQPDETAADILARLAARHEAFEFAGRSLYLHAPSGIGRSRFAASV